MTKKKDTNNCKSLTVWLLTCFFNVSVLYNVTEQNTDILSLDCSVNWVSIML